MTIRELLKRIFWPYRRHKSRTVRYAFPLIFVVAAFLGANVINSETKSFIEVESSTQNVRAGEMFEIDVYVSVHAPVNAVDIELTFPPEQVQVTGIDTGESVITLWAEDPYVEQNTVVLRGGTFRKGFLGRHLIATINARAKETGVAYFEVTNSTFLSGDGSGSEVAISENGEEKAQLYITNADGAITLSGSDDSTGVEAAVAIRIVTDIDGDGDVSLQDISRFMAAWNSKAEVFDFSGDGKMTFRDFAIILAQSFLR
tara:strand:+ start:288 stop:1061 length:774 start_codon:yes stop_codon:yes gene_type:complete